MESEEKENIEQNLDELTADLSKRSLKKIERANNEQKAAVTLILDRNELQRLDNLDTYPNVKRLSLSNNRLIRMEGVSCAVCLTVLDISNNSLVCIEGLKDLKNLKHLNLAGNKIKTIDHLNYNVFLEYLDLSQNIIGHISDISFLQNLKELFLHNNEIVHLRQCEKNLPSGLETLTLNNNCITDLNEISHLVFLSSLKELSFSNNPCLDFTDSRILKAEWLYSQGRGRNFRPGEHIALAKYLTGVCPRTIEANVESEDEKKLRLILSKAHHHQQQLKEELTGSTPSPNRHKLPLNRKKSSAAVERMVSSYHDSTPKETARGGRDLMTRSLDGVLLRNSPGPQNELPESYRSPLQTATTLLPVPESLTSPDVCRSLHQFPTPTSNSKLPFPLATSYPNRNHLSSSKSSHLPTPESKIKSPSVLRRQNNNYSPVSSRKCEGFGSPSNCRSTPVKGVSPKKKLTPASAARRVQANGKESSEECDSEYSSLKSQTLSSQKRHKNHSLSSDGKENFEGSSRKNSGSNGGEADVWRAALCIQRHWRGYRARNLNQKVIETYKNIQTTRIQDYIIKVANDMEATKVTLEGHRKLQVLQMRAINALWKKMVTLQPGDVTASSGENKSTLQGLAETCFNLNKQMEELQNMMKEVLHQPSQCQSTPMGTQTEIVAVHTPQDEERDHFPYRSRSERPSALHVNGGSSEPVEQFPPHAAADATKTVSSTPESGSGCETNECVTEISNGSCAKDNEESVCLTPACQEGRDLQSVANSESELSARTNGCDNCQTEGSSFGNAEAPSSNFPSENSSNDREEQNGCPSS